MFGLRTILLAVVAGAAILMAPNPADGVPQYRIVALEPLPDGVDSRATAINELGVVVGYSTLDRSGNVGRARPVMWDANGHPTELWPNEGLSTPGGIPLGINNAGQVVGRYGVGSGVPLPIIGVPEGRAFIWDNQNGRHDLGSLGGNRIEAVAINELGQVAGTSSLPGLGTGEEPFIWDQRNGMRTLGSLAAVIGLGRAAAINNQGQIVGTSWLEDQSEHPFLWDPAEDMHDIGVPGREGRAFGINDTGKVVGFSEISASFGGAFLWTETDGIESLALMEAPFTFGLDINNHDQIVGRRASNDGPVAVIWDRANGTRDLAALIPVDSGWHLERATAINNRGQIVGYGRLNDNIRGFLMTPVPELSSQTFAIIAACAIVLLPMRGSTCSRRKLPIRNCTAYLSKRFSYTTKGVYHGTIKAFARERVEEWSTQCQSQRPPRDD